MRLSDSTQPRNPEARNLFGRAIYRAIIDNNQFVIQMGLLQDGVDSLRNKRANVVGRQDHRYLRCNMLWIFCIHA